MIRRLQWAALVSLFIGISGTWCVLAAEPQSENPAELAKNSPSASGTRSLPPALPDNDYRLGVNDVLDVHVWREPELSRVVPVRPDGKISLPLAGELRAQDRTATELRSAIAERLKEYVTAPEVTVIVREINSQRYFVIGEVQQPGVFPLTVPVTAMQALAMAGGFREFADTDDIFILRRTEDDRTIRIEFSYKDWVKDKKVVEHLQLLNGDVVVVP